MELNQRVETGLEIDQEIVDFDDETMGPIFTRGLFMERGKFKLSKIVDKHKSEFPSNYWKTLKRVPNIHAVSITSNDIMELFEIIENNNDVYDEDILSLPLNTFSTVDFDALVGLRLHESTDNEILKDIKLLLPKLRYFTGAKAPKRYNIDDKCTLLSTCWVFKYLDLTLWARSNGHEISNKKLAEFIIEEKKLDQLEEQGIDIAKLVSDKVRKHAQHAISAEFLNQLYDKAYHQTFTNPYFESC